MAGTVLITGANGSLALGFVQHLLTTYPTYTLIAAVRDDKDANTARLSAITSSSTIAHIEKVDLGSLDNVRSFAESVAARISSGEIPRISAIVCNAFTWSLNGQLSTQDGMESTFQVGHLSHYLLVLKLLRSMASDGRVVMLSSDTHYAERPHPFSRLRAEMPDDVEALVKPRADDGEEHDRGFQRYGTTKLANVMFMHDLGERLEKDPNLSGISVIAVDPRGMLDSRGNTKLKPSFRAIFSILNVMLPAVNIFTTAVRKAAYSGREVAELSVGKGYKGYYVGSERGEPSIGSKDVKKQKILWDACWKWTGLTREECVLKGAEP